MDVFRRQDYRTALASLFESQKKLRGNRWTLARLGEATGIQASYLTNATKLRAHFSSDQIYAIGTQLGLALTEIEFLDLLMQWERATHPARKSELFSKVESIRKANLRITKHVPIPKAALPESSLNRYYLDPNIELLHLYLGTKNAPIDLEEIAWRWGLPSRLVADVIEFLEQASLVKRNGRKWSVEEVYQHLERESPLCKPQQMMKRLRAIETLQKLPPERAYTYTATVTMSEQTKLEIQGRFIAFFKECETLIRESPPENIYEFQFNLFPWLIEEN